MTNIRRQLEQEADAREPHRPRTVSDEIVSFIPDTFLGGDDEEKHPRFLCSGRWKNWETKRKGR